MDTAELATTIAALLRERKWHIERRFTTTGSEQINVTLPAGQSFNITITKARS